MSHEAMLQPYQPDDRSDVVEARLTNQERTMSVLLEQALRIKEEVVIGLRSTQGSVLSEASARRLLEKHILTITHIVKQLSTNMQVLEREMAQRDSVTSGTSFAVQSLDHKNLAGIGDLRGRVARCDASIAQLSGDVSSWGKEIHSLQQEVTELRSGLEVRLKDMELKLSQAVGRLEASLTEQTHSQRSSWTDLHNHLNLLEDKSSSGLKEAMEDTHTLRRWTEQQLRSSEQTHTQGSEQTRSLLRDKMVEVEGRLSEQLGLLAVRVERAERHLEQEHQADRVRRSETKLLNRISTVDTGLREELQLVRQEYQSGFKSIHDSIDSLKQISDSKAKLDKEKLQKDIKHIRRKMVELRDV